MNTHDEARALAKQLRDAIINAPIEINLLDAMKPVLFAALSKAKQPVRWTKNKPTTPGWYWYKDGSAEVIVQVEIGLFDSFHKEFVQWSGAKQRTPLHHLTGVWDGPLAPPGENHE
jgi:hypothetical protein